MNQWKIRTANAGDAAAIQAVARESWADVYDGIIPADIQRQAIAAWYSMDALERSINSPDVISLVAEGDDRVIGFLDLAIQGDGAAELRRIYVLPVDQRKGAGRSLLEEALAFGWKLGVRVMSVAVAQGNGRAKAFYERTGFNPTGVRTIDLFGFPVEESTYTLNLGSGMPARHR